MADIKVLGQPAASNRLGSTPWGNVSAFNYSLTLDSSGKVVGGDSTSAVAASDNVLIGILPGGFRYIDAVVRIPDAGAGDFSLGWFRDSSDKDVDAFVLDADLDSAVPVRADGALPVKLDEDAWLVLVPDTNQTAAAVVNITIYAVAEGVA